MKRHVYSVRLARKNLLDAIRADAARTPTPAERDHFARSPNEV